MLDSKKIRADFPILSKLIYGKPLIYLDNASTTQKPNDVISALSSYYTSHNSNVHRGVHALSMEATDMFEEARRKVSSFIGSDTPQSVIWTRGTTEAINLVASTWARDNLHEGDQIALTQMEHHSNLVPWQKVAREQGVTLQFIPLTNDGKLDLSKIDSIINKRTKLVSVAHVSNSLGTINPVEEITVKAHAVGAKILIDGAQSAPHIPINIKNLDCDFFAFSGHKMLGPTGIGVLYVKPDVLSTMEPFMLGGDMVLEVWNDRATWNDLPMRFEAGTPNIADAIAMGTAIDYLNKIGMNSIRHHEMELTRYALASLSELEELDILGPQDVSERCGVISMHSSSIHPHDLGTYLDQQGIAIRTGHHCTMPLMRTLGLSATARASFYIYNTTREVDILVNTLKQALKYFSNGAS